MSDTISSMDDTAGSLTQLERSIIIGSILGDGYLRIVRGRKNALLEINHSYKQKDYVDWKHCQLKRLCIGQPTKRNTNGSRVAYRFNTIQHPELTQLHSIFYRNGKKIIPQGIVLDPIMVAVWYMDDGSKCRESDVYFNTQQFSQEDQMILSKLLEKMNIETSLNKDKTYSRLRVKKTSLPALWRLLNPNVIPSMYYKLSYNPVETCS